MVSGFQIFPTKPIQWMMRWALSPFAFCCGKRWKASSFLHSNLRRGDMFDVCLTVCGKPGQLADIGCNPTWELHHNQLRFLVLSIGYTKLYHITRVCSGDKTIPYEIHLETCSPQPGRCSTLTIVMIIIITIIIIIIIIITITITIIIIIIFIFMRGVKIRHPLWKICWLG